MSAGVTSGVNVVCQFVSQVMSVECRFVPGEVLVSCVLVSRALSGLCLTGPVTRRLKMDDGSAKSEDDPAGNGDGTAGGEPERSVRSDLTVPRAEAGPPEQPEPELEQPEQTELEPEQPQSEPEPRSVQPEPEPELEWDAVEDGAVPSSDDWNCSPTKPRSAATAAATESDWSPAPRDDDRSHSPVPEETAPPPEDDDFTLAASAGPQPVELSGRCGYVWSSAAARRLRQLGVPGQLAGGLARAPRQTSQLGLPLTLLPEETALLHSQGGEIAADAR